MEEHNVLEMAAFTLKVMVMKSYMMEEMEKHTFLEMVALTL